MQNSGALKAGLGTPANLGEMWRVTVGAAPSTQLDSRLFVPPNRHWPDIELWETNPSISM